MRGHRLPARRAGVGGLRRGLAGAGVAPRCGAAGRGVEPVITRRELLSGSGDPEAHYTEAAVKGALVRWRSLEAGQ